MIKKFKNIPKFIVLMFIHFYKACISPMFPGCCRYRPTCSEYALQAIQKFGLCKGIILTIKRLSRCHPWGGKGYDPIPEKFEFKHHNCCKSKNLVK